MSFTDWLTTATELGTAGANAYATVKGTNQQAAPVAAPAERPAWLIPAAIGGGLLVLVLLFMGLSKK